jgi:hypothetical protein
VYLGPLRWPTRAILVAAAAATVAIGALAAAGVSPVVPTVVIVIVVLLIAAPRRIRDLGGDEMRDSRPDE